MFQNAVFISQEPDEVHDVKFLDFSGALRAPILQETSVFIRGQDKKGHKGRS